MKQELPAYLRHKLPKRTIAKVVVTRKKGDFEAFHAAEKEVRDAGFAIGSMCRDMPIGFAKGVDYIAKWYNIDVEDHCRLDGVFISDNFRDGGTVYTVYFASVIGKR